MILVSGEKESAWYPAIISVSKEKCFKNNREELAACNLRPKNIHI